MSGTRTRTSSFAWPGGGNAFRSFGATVVTNDTQAPYSPYVRSVCNDTVGLIGLDNPLDIVHVDLSGIRPLNGEVGIPGIGFYERYTNWMPQGNQASPVPATSSLPSDGSVATTVLARSNPSRADISLPNFIFELKDLPGMLRDIGKLKFLLSDLKKLGQDFRPRNAREFANHQLAVQMGWQPLISDIRKMMDFHSKVDKRILALDALLNNGGLHRTVGKGRPASKTRKAITPMWSDVVTTQNTLTIESGLGLLIQVRADKITRTEKWGSVRWIPTNPPSTRYSNQDLTRLARSLVFGLNLNTKAIWDAIPWTWLIDWFTNAGDYLDATNNQVPCVPSLPCVMTHTEHTESWTRIDGNKTIDGGSGTRRYEQKHRSINAASLSASIPFLSGRQLSILGALAIQRLR